jgi:hypothetical protein
MAGALTISTLNDDAGVLATQNGMTGIAKAWVNFDGTGTVAIRGSFNVSSITDNGTGDYTVNFTTAMPDANYSVNATARVVSGTSGIYAQINSDPTTSSVEINTKGPTQLSGGGLSYNSSVVCVSVFSS